MFEDMPRGLRSSLPDGFFHVVSRGVFGAQIYVDEIDRRRFVDLLTENEKARRWSCMAYCLMGTHYHLVVEARRTDLSQGMHQLNARHALAFNRRHRRYGALFAERFSVRLIEHEEYLHEACAYVVLNPVRAGLCDRAEEWPWSYSHFGLEAA
jgi:REP element-mobilizing transposase RayT